MNHAPVLFSGIFYFNGNVKILPVISESIKKFKSSKIKEYLFTNRGTKQTIIKNSFWLFLAEFVNKGLMFLLTILIARYLGVEGYGQLSFSFAFVSLFAVVADFGLSTLLIREVARNKEMVSKYVSNISVLKLALGMIVLIIIFAITPYIGKEAAVKNLIYIAGIYTVVCTLNDLPMSVFRAFEQMQYEAMSKMVSGIAAIAFIGTAMYLRKPVGYIMLGYLCSSVVRFLITLFWGWKNFFKISLKIDWNILKDIMREAWPFFVSGIFVLIYLRVTTIMLSYFIGDRAVGIYSAAYNLVYTFQFIPTLLLNAIFPMLAYTYNEDINRFIKIYKKLLTLSLWSTPFFVLIFISTKVLINILYGSAYNDSATVLQIMIWGELCSFFSVVFLYILNSMNKHHLYTITVFSALTINVTANLVLIPLYGYIGASISLCLTELFAMLMLFKLTRDEIAKWISPVKDSL